MVLKVRLTHNIDTQAMHANLLEPHTLTIPNHILMSRKRNLIIKSSGIVLIRSITDVCHALLSIEIMREFVKPYFI